MNEKEDDKLTNRIRSAVVLPAKRAAVKDTTHYTYSGSAANACVGAAVTPVLVPIIPS